MAAGAYKGLTIQIGADTSKLAGALRGASSAIYKTQSELRKLNNAAKLDPGNVSVISGQIGALSEQAVNAAANMDYLSQGIDKLGNSVKVINALGDATDQTVASFAASEGQMKSLTLEAERAKQRLMETDAELNRLYKDIKSSPSGLDIRAATDNGTYDKEWLKEQVKTGMLSQEQADKVEALKAKWGEANAAYENYTNAAKLQSMNNDLAAQEASFNDLGKKIVDASSQLATFDRYSSGSFKGIGDDLQPVNERLTLVSAAAEVAGERFRSLDSSMSLNYGGMDFLRERADALNQSIETAQLQAEQLQKRVDAYKANGVEDLARNMGNVSVEVQQSEKAFIEANANLERFKATGDTTHGTFEQLKRAVETARERMDTAHGVQQYQALQQQLHKTKSEAVDLALKLADVNKPSEVSSTGAMRQLSRDIDYIGKAMRQSESDAKTMGDALKINPQNMGAAVEQAKLLGNALKMAEEEGENLRQKYQSYDLTAIKEAADYSKSAAQQTLDAANDYDRAAESVRDYDLQVLKAQSDMKDAEIAGDTDAWAAAAESYEKLAETSKRAHESMEQAGKQLDLSKQREEVERLETDMAKNVYTTDKLTIAMNRLGQTDATPKYDLNVSKSMGDALKGLEGGRGDSSALRQATTNLEGMRAAADAASDRFDRLDAAMQLDPSNMDLAKSRVEALVTAMSTNSNEMDALKAAMGSIPSEKLDQAAIASGNVAANMVDAKSRFDEAQRAVDSYEAKIRQLTDDLRKMEEKEGTQILSDDEVAKMGELRERIATLKEGMAGYVAEAERAFRDIDVARASQQYQEMGTRFDELSANAKKYEETILGIRTPSNIASSLEPVDRNLKLITTGAENAKSRFETLKSAAEIRPYSISLAADKTKAFAEAIKAAHDRADVLRQKIDAYRSTGIGEIADKTHDAATAFELASNKVGELRLKLEQAERQYGKNSNEAKELGRQLEAAMKEADTAAAVNELKELEAEERSVKAEAKQMADSMKSGFSDVGAAAVVAAQQVGQLVSQAGQQIIQASSDIDSSYRDLRKTFEAEESEYQTLYDAAMKYSQSHVTSADKMLEMEAIAAQVGVGIEGGADAIQHFAEVASNLDVATDINADEIALEMGQIVNVMGDLREDNVERFGDALVRLGNTMPAQESAIMQITQRLSAVGSVANFTTPELLGWAAAIAGTGQRSEAAATGISNTITAIQKAVGAGGDALDTFAETAGMSAEKFAEKWQEAPTEALKLFLKGLNGLDEAALQRLEDLDITGVRQTQTLLALAQTTDTVTDAINSANEAWGDEAKGIASSGDAAKEAEKKAQGFSGVLEKLKNSVQVLAASFGEALVPWMERATVWIQNFGKWLDSMGSGFKRTTVLVGGALVAFSTIEPIVAALAGNLITLASGAIRAVVQGFTMLPAVVKGTGVILRSFVANPVAVSSALSGAGGAAGAFGSALSLLATPAGVAVGAIGLVAAAIGGEYIVKMMKAKKYNDEFKESVESIKGVTEGLGRSMAIGSGIDEYTEKWSAARVEMEKYHDSLKEHTDAQNESRRAMEETVGQFDRYQEILDGAIGKGDDYSGSMGQLMWAIDGLNEATGEAWTVEDILTGKFQDQSGVVKSTRDELDKLIETRRREAKINATEDMLTENYKAQEENAEKRKEAAAAYRNYLDMMWDVAKESGKAAQYATKQDFAKDMLKSNEHFQGLALDVKNLRSESILLDEQEQHLIATLDTLQTTAGRRDNIILDDEEMRKSAESIGLTGDALTQFTNRLEDSKVGVTEFAEMSSKDFDKMVQESGGDIDKLVDLVSEWNMQKLEDKYGEFNFDEQAFIDAEGNRTEWNDGEWKPAQVEIEGVSGAREQLMLLNDSMREALISTMGWGDSAEEIQPKVHELAQKLEEAHVGMGRFNDLAENHPDVFTDMVTQADGDMDTLVGLIDEWNRQQLNDINFGIIWDGDDAFTTAEGVRYEWNNGEWRKVELDVDSSKVPEQAEEAKAQVESDKATQPVDADTSEAEGKVSKLRSDLETSPITLRFYADMSGAETPNMSDQSFTLKSKADTSGATEMAKAIAKVPKNTTAKVTAKTEGKKSVDDLRASLKKASGNYSARLNASVSGASGVNDLLRTLRDANGRKYSVTFDTYRVTHYSTTGKPNAKGGYVPGMLNIPRHADGFIATRPTLTQYGWIGEDGAEAYSGGSLVPLTNRKYSQPYIDDISDAVAKKLGPTGSGPQVNITITGVEGADDVAQAIARQFALLDL